MTTHSYFILEIVGEGIQHVVEVPSSRLVRVVREEFEQASALLAWGFQETMQEHCRLGFYDVVCEERVAELTRHFTYYYDSPFSKAAGCSKSDCAAHWDGP